MMRQLVANHHTVIFISHKLNEIMEICDRCTVLRLGRLADTVCIKDVKNRQELASLMVGHDVELTTKIKSVKPGQVLLKIQDLCCQSDRGLPMLKNVNLELREGEILGICGVDGNGQSELVSLLAQRLHRYAVADDVRLPRSTTPATEHSRDAAADVPARASPPAGLDRSKAASPENHMRRAWLPLRPYRWCHAPKS